MCFGTDEAVCRRKVTSGRMAAGSIRTLQLHCARVLYESLFVPFFIFDIKI